MRPIRLLVIFFLVVFLGAALIAPWLFHIVAAHSSSGPLFQSLAKQPFHRYVNRCLIFLALVGLLPFFWLLGMRSLHDFGFAPLAGGARNLGKGFLVGFFSLAILAALALGFGARTFEHINQPVAFGLQLLLVLITAVAIALVEETIFRGAIFGAIRRSTSWLKALAISSGIYALVHFFAKPPSPNPVEWNSGFIVLAGMLHGFVQWQTFVPAFFNLVLVGAILGVAYQRTRTLYFSIGLHAGWIFWLKFYGMLTKKGGANHLMFFGTFKMIDGWLATIILCAVFVALFKLLRPKVANDLQS